MINGTIRIDQPPVAVADPGGAPYAVDRVTILWEDYYLAGGDPPCPWVVNPNGIGNQGLQVRVVAGNLGMAEDDVFYFGNAIADSNNSATDTIVNATDEVNARLNPHWFLDPARIDDPVDFNRDQRVDATDEIHARFNQTYFLADLNLITTPPSAPLPGPTSAPSGSASMPGPEVPAIEQAAARAGRQSPDRDLCSRLAWSGVWDAMDSRVKSPDHGKSPEAAVDELLGQFDL